MDMIPLRTGRDATKVAMRLAMRAGEEAFYAGQRRYPEPFSTALERGAYRDGWNRAAAESVNDKLTGVA